LDFIAVSATGTAGVTAGDAVLSLTSTNGISVDATAADALGVAGDITEVTTLDASVITMAAAAAGVDDSVIRPSCFCGVFWRLIT